MRIIKSLVGEDEIKKMWNNYFHKLYDENPVRDVGIDDRYSPRDVILL